MLLGIFSEVLHNSKVFVIVENPTFDEHNLLEIRVPGSLLLVYLRGGGTWLQIYKGFVKNLLVQQVKAVLLY